MSNELIEGLAYAKDAPDLKSIADIYGQDLSNHSGYADQCRDSRNQRVNWWPGKTLDQRKNGVDSKPWPGSSDVEVPVIDVRANTLIAYMMNAIHDGNITAAPIGSDDVERAAQASVFCRWMLDTWIPKAYDHIELSLNNMLEKGIAATWVGWEKRNRVHLEEIDIDVIAEEAPDLADLLMDEGADDQVIEMLNQNYEFADPREVKKALKELRKTGTTKVPVVKQDINRPIIEAKCPRADVIFPSYTMNIEDVDRCHVRHFMSIQGLKSAQKAEGWDKEWTDDIIKNHMGVTQGDIEGQYGNRSPYTANQTSTLFNAGNRDARDLVEVVRTIQVMVDEKTGAVGYYQTVWCPKQVDNLRNKSDGYYGIFELLNGWDELPIAITTLTRDSKCIYDQRNMGDLLRGNQRLTKVTRDAFVDQQSLHLNPPRTHPAGRPASMWGAGADFATRRGEENLYKTLDIPSTMREGVEMETFLEAEADRIMGLSEESQNSITRRQYFVNRALAHVSEIVRLAYKAFQKFYDGEDIMFRVTGVADPQAFNRSPHDEEMDIKLFYNVRSGDPEYIKESSNFAISLLQLDTEGTFERNKMLQDLAMLNAPQLASGWIKPQGESVADVQKNVAEDLTMIFAGNSVNARQQGAQIALQYIQGYVQQPSIQEKMQTDPVYAQSLGAYVQQYEMQIQQTQNAVTGRLGAPQQDITNS